MVSLFFLEVVFSYGHSTTLVNYPPKYRGMYSLGTTTHVTVQDTDDAALTLFQDKDCL